MPRATAARDAMGDDMARWRPGNDDEAYRPVIEDGRGRFPEDLRVKAPRGARAVIAAAAEPKNTSHAEYVRQALLRCLEADGVRLRRGSWNSLSKLHSHSNRF
jgi:hypothetical protein